MPDQPHLVFPPADQSAAAAPAPPLPLPVQPYVDELYLPPVVQPAAADDGARLTVWMHPARVQLHAELPSTTAIWTYSASAQPPGDRSPPLAPVIEVQQRQAVHVAWCNALTAPDGTFAPHPVVAVRDLPARVQLVSTGGVYASENLLGFTLGRVDQTAVPLPPWTVVHLHGARAVADADGWPETGYYPGAVQHGVYGNDQPGTLLWFHDHAMAMTRLNVYAGLAGLYVIRDPLEAVLKLPRGSDDHELLLLIQDRALTVAGDDPAIAAAQLLHKTGTAGGAAIPIPGGPATVDQAPMEFFGPLTLVNGRIWPRATVHADVYRLRILNGANARTFRLRFTNTDGAPVAVPLQLIGSDGGLLAQPVDLNDPQRLQPGAFTLMQAERVDLLVDFSAYAGQRIELRNAAMAPFDGTDVDAADPLSGLLPYPQVMCFDVGARSRRHRLLPWDQELLPSAQPWSLHTVRQMKPVERLIALVEDDTGMLQLLECLALTERGTPIHWTPGTPLPANQLALRQRGQRRYRRYRLLAGMFSSTTNILARDGDVELWTLLNLSEDSHPIHLHLVHFKLVAREAYTAVERPTGEHGAPGGYATAHDAHAPDTVLDAAEMGWKDTIRVDPRQLATIAVPFRAYAPADTQPAQGTPLNLTGRYMYHCHTLEHEDHEMMRPYVVMPPAVIDHMHAVNAARLEPSEQTPAETGGWYMAPSMSGDDGMPMTPATDGARGDQAGPS